MPLIAARAGVTPSTIYRPWGDLADLLADVAVARMRPDNEPVDTGPVKGDMHAWAEQFLDEMSSEVGQAMLRYVLSAGSSSEMPVPCRCAQFTASQIEVIIERGIAHGQPVPEADAVMDGVVAPIIYRVLFGPTPATYARVHELVEACLQSANIKRKRKLSTAV